MFSFVELIFCFVFDLFGNLGNTVGAQGFIDGRRGLFACFQIKKRWKPKEFEIDIEPLYLCITQALSAAVALSFALNIH